MTKIFLITAFLFNTHLFSSLTILGDEKNYKESENSIVWTLKNKIWSVSQPLQNINLQQIKKNSNGFVLLNTPQKNMLTKPHNEAVYTLQKGWNYVTSYRDGVDVEATFGMSDAVEFVYVYENHSKVWAGYSPNKTLMTKMLDTRILDAKYIEPNIGFYVYATKKTVVEISYTTPSAKCYEKMVDTNYMKLEDSGINREETTNAKEGMSLKSRYFTHHKRGIYNDTRVLLIYPKLEKLDKSSELLGYGPAIPKVMLNFNRAYEEKSFFVFDYHKKECYEGILPSRNIPPLSVLKKLK